MERPLALWLASCCVLGCRMANPAFEDGDSVADDASESSASESSSSESSASESNSTHASSTHASESSETHASSETDTASLPDLPVEACDATPTSAFALLYGTANQFGGVCPPAVFTTMKIVGPGPLPGLMTGSLCGADCSGTCDGAQYVFGATGLDDFTTPLLEAANQVKTCVRIEAVGGLGLDPSSRCLYTSMWAGQGEQTRLLAVARQGLLPETGELLLQGKSLPVPGETVSGCPCDTLDLTDAELSCCQAARIEPSFHSLAFLGVDLLPGQAGDVVLESATFTFHVAQAQQLGSCENPAAQPEASWALVWQ